MKFKAVIFDFDGLMFNTEKIWQDYFFKANEVFKSNFTEQDRIQFIGKNEKEIRKFLKSKKLDINVDAYRDWMCEKVNNHINKFGAEVKPGLIQLIDYCKTNNILMGIASGSAKGKILNCLSLAKIDEDNFKVIVGGDTEINPKPNPDIYLYVCSQLGLDSKECLVLEDSYLGVEAGHNAGCFTIMIPDTLPVTEHMKNTADLILNDLNEVIFYIMKQS